MNAIEKTIEVDVLIIGSGPSGATASLALGRYGVTNLCISKYSSTSNSPRAHITNQRTMEILRHFGLDEQAMAVATPHHLMGDHVYCTALAGFELGRLKSWHTHPRYKAQHDLISPCSMVDLTQDLLEPILLAGAMRAGSRVRFDTELLDFEQDQGGVTAYVLDRITGARSTFRARYMIGADGANSRVLERLGLQLEGPTNIAANIGILFKADLSSFVAHRPGVLYWIVQPGQGIGGYPIAGLRMVRAWDRWVATWGFDAKDEPPVLSTERATDIVHRIIGDTSVDVEIQGTHCWRMNRVQANAYSLGRVFCMGDAVHRHPPMNGLGSNTSVQDAFNLAWKLAMVVRGEAGTKLLDSYEAERMPIGHDVVRRATENFRVYAPVAQALGFKPGEQTPTQFDALPADLADPSPAGITRRAKLQAAIAGNIVGFGALGGEHNQRYRSDAIVEDTEILSVENPELDVIMGVEAGRRLPHVWLTRKHHRISSLDICTLGAFSLLTGVGGTAWTEAAANVASAIGLPIHIVRVGPGQRFEDPYGDFSRICLADETGAILVRPDLYVAWRVPTLPDDPEAALHQTMVSILALSGEKQT